jgi:hypothetical protein
MCDYTLTGSVEVTAKPWGSVSKPDCSGFTLTQFSELNIGKMDLSEWTATIQTKILPNTSTFATQATAQAQANQTNGSNPQLQSGPVGGITPMTAAVSPLQALGPFTAQLTVSSNWPAAGILPNDPISSVEIDWGDCSGASAASAQPSGGYAAQHLYRAPNTAGMCDSNGAANPLSPRNLNEVIKLTIRSSSGTHAYQLNVINAWQDFQSTNGPGSASTTGP